MVTQVNDTANYVDSTGQRREAEGVFVVGSSPGSGNPAVDGDLQLVPNGSTNGTVLPARPYGVSGVIFYLAAGDSVTYAIATAQPTSAPAVTNTVSGASYAQWSEPLGIATAVYVTAKTGTPRFRFI